MNDVATGSGLIAVRRTRVIEASPQAVFDALTQGEPLTRWLCRKATLQPRKGGKVHLEWPDEVAEGTVSEIVPGECLSLSVQRGERPSSGSSSTIEFHVRPEGAAARVTVAETGAASSDVERKKLERSWAHHLERLRSLFEDGAQPLRDSLETTAIPAPGQSPYGVAWDGRNVWHSDADAGKLFKLDPKTGKALAEHEVGGAPTGLDWDGSSLWALDGKRRALMQVDPTSGSVRRRLKIARVAGELTDVAWDGKSLWVGMTGEGGKIARLDVRTGMAQSSIPSPPGMSGIAFDSASGAHLWVAALRARTVTRVETRKGLTIERYGLRGEPAGIAWDGECLWHTDLEMRQLVRARLLAEPSS